MDLKFFVVLLFAFNCNAQQRLPVVTTRNNILSGEGITNTLRTIPSGNVRQFLTYPTIRNANNGLVVNRGLGQLVSNNLGLGQFVSNNFGLVQERAPVLIPEPVLERVATLGLTNGLTGGIALGSNRIGQVLGPVIAAIITQRTAEVVDVPVPQDIIHPQVLIVEPNLLPVTIEFRSQSSPVNINQVHIPGPPGEFKETRSEEEPDRVLHEVVKPVIQEVREIIQPFRRITQEILPVQEEIHSVVARGDNQRVIQDVAIPAPVPLTIPVAPAPVAVAAPLAVAAPQVAVAAPVAVAGPRLSVVQQPVSFERTVSVQPLNLDQSIGQSLGTVVRAGLLGGYRIIQAPGIFDAGLNRGGLEGTVLTDVARNNIKREAVQSIRASVNNRPNAPAKS